MSKNNRRVTCGLQQTYSFRRIQGDKFVKNIRKIMNESFKKSETELRQDFSKNVLKQLELEDDINWGIHPAIKILIIFTITVLVVTSIVLSIVSI